MKVGLRDVFFLGVVGLGAAAMGAGLMRTQDPSSPQQQKKKELKSDIDAAVKAVDDSFHRQWSADKLAPAAPAGDLTLMRRLSMALCGTVPSLEEIRRFEVRPKETRISEWLDALLRDRRCSDYLAERFARVYVGTEDGPFILYRRRRFIAWLSDTLLENRRYDGLVRDMIADRGLWTDNPATNFVSVTYDPDLKTPTPERLAARVARAFLGVRIDCAQCHDHPFQKWKQDDFRGLASFFGGVNSSLRGIRDGEKNEYHPPDRKTKEPVDVAPCVPFRPELKPDSGSPREQLAAWVTDPRNTSFSQATVNRVWALLLGRPLAEPVDDLPAAGQLHPVLDVLAADFAAHDYDLHRLIRVIAGSEVFRLDSVTEAKDPEELEAAWAVFPMTRLRPEQVAGALFQAASVTTLGPQSHWFVRAATYTGRNDFVRRYGDSGEDEFDAQTGTIPQRLLLMNGQIAREKIGAGLFTSSGQIAGLAADDRAAVETAFLSVLTRRPTSEELTHFTARIDKSKGDARKERLTDLFWALLNTTEFSWSH
jgi:Protein of unknown function (DUF1549)/Protein of unknown function (DUF1553)